MTTARPRRAGKYTWKCDARVQGGSLIREMDRQNGVLITGSSTIMDRVELATNLVQHFVVQSFDWFQIHT